MQVTQDNLYLCTDCTMVACNGSAGADIEPAQLQRTQAGLVALGPHLVPNFDSETGDGLREFSSSPCSGCGSELAGYRARFAILGE
jgi:hypothetical protein